MIDKLGIILSIERQKNKSDKKMIKSISVFAFLFILNIQINNVLATSLLSNNANVARNNPKSEVLTMAVAEQIKNSNVVEVLVHSKVSGKSQIIVLNGKTGKIVHTASVRLKEGENKVSIDTTEFPEGDIYKVILSKPDSKVNASTLFKKEKKN